MPGQIRCHAADRRVELAAQRVCQPNHPVRSDPPRLDIWIERGIAPAPDGYRITIKPEEIAVRGGSAEGCFHALQTLDQLAGNGQPLPCCEIVDWPDFAVRGLLHDVTRGKVPTLATLKLLVDRLASLKCNQLQLYIEHAFVFDLDPHICDADNGLTPDEIRELDTYCRERFIDLVPAVATLGHMGRILSMPKHRQLAEIEPDRPWEQLSWPKRARGLTLDVLNPQSQQLVERIWTEVLDAFSSPVVNICGDEPWDLGKGRNRDRIPAEKIGQAYIDHILRTRAICEKRGRRVQVWSDVVTRYPEFFGRLPRDLTILHWGYDDKTDYEGTRRFVDADLKTFVCPGTSGWKRVLNAMNLAERNIGSFARAGKDCGASGLLNTDWGDHGHFNALASSWHGIALGAACGWRADDPAGADFDLRFAQWLFPDQNSCGEQNWVNHLREASKIAEKCETWRLLWQPVAAARDDASLPSVEQADGASTFAQEAASMLQDMPPSVDVDELRLACLATRLFHAKVQLARNVPAKNDIVDLVEQVRDLLRRTWERRNKESGRGDVMAALNSVRAEFGRSEDT